MEAERNQARNQKCSQARTEARSETSIDALKAFAACGCYRQAPLVRRIQLDTSPVDVLRQLKRISSHSFLLESADLSSRKSPDLSSRKSADLGSRGRHSFLGFDPKLEIYCKQGHMRVGDLEIETDNPAQVIRQILHEHTSPHIPGLPSFCGGLVGYFSFEFLGYQETTIAAQKHITGDFRDVDLMLFDHVIAFDHLTHEIILIAQVAFDHLETNYRKALHELDDLQRLIEVSACEAREAKADEKANTSAHENANTYENGSHLAYSAGRITGPVSATHDKQGFCEMVRKAKAHITEGDIFQIVLSNRLSAPYQGDLMSTYEALKAINPSPYMFYFSGDDLEIAGASPETLVKLENDILHTYPLAGTRRRGSTPAEDKVLELDLLSDEKELAEHNMLVDLGRNDLGKVCDFGTVKVEQLHTIERFSHVMHIGSAVRGHIAQDKDALDAILSTMPAGTLSGAPKISACRLIAQLEGVRRGIYGGAIGYIDFDGNMDTCIGIRLVYKKDGQIFVHTGAGIVADSDPEKEYEECFNKAKSSLAAIQMDADASAPVQAPVQAPAHADSHADPHAAARAQKEA